jgi:hypothetical protein
MRSRQSCASAPNATIVRCRGELMAILEAAAYETRAAAAPADGLLERLLAIAGSRGIETTKRLTRERAHDRKLLRKSGGRT